MALTILTAKLPSGETPVCGVTLEPYVTFRRGDALQPHTADEVPEEGLGDPRYSLRFRWYRSVLNRGGAVCWVHPQREATIQCVLCLRTNSDVRTSFHCSTECFKRHWQQHKESHEQKRLNGEDLVAAGYFVLVSVCTLTGNFGLFA